MWRRLNLLLLSLVNQIHLLLSLYYRILNNNHPPLLFHNIYSFKLTLISLIWKCWWKEKYQINNIICPTSVLRRVLSQIHIAEFSFLSEDGITERKQKLDSDIHQFKFYLNNWVMTLTKIICLWALISIP